MSGTTVLTELRRIAAANGGTLTPAAVVEDSRPEDAPLHDRFEWDDSIAGEKYREIEAARLIRQAHVTVVPGPNREMVRVRAFLAPGESAEDADPTPWTYIPIEQLSESAKAAVLAQMEKDVAALRRKYRQHLEALNALILGEGAA